jgi:hypothetical protein
LRLLVTTEHEGEEGRKRSSLRTSKIPSNNINVLERMFGEELSSCSLL